MKTETELRQQVKLLRKTLRLVLRIIPNDTKQIWMFKSRKEMERSFPGHMKGQTLGTTISKVLSDTCPERLRRTKS